MRKSIASFAWWGAALLSFAYGCLATGRWYWGFPVALWAMAWLLAGRARAGLCLGASVLLAALGIVAGARTVPMILGLASSLGLWDYAGADAESYRSSRLPYALLALVPGAALAAIGSTSRLDLPFYAMLACILACAFCVDRVARYLGRRERPRD
jgi:hypothetical protein